MQIQTSLILNKAVRHLFVVLGFIALTSCSSSENHDGTTKESVVLKDQVSLPLLQSLDSYDNSGQARSIIVENDLVYIADGTFGLNILRVQVDNTLTSIGSYSVSSKAYDVEKNGDYIYLSARDAGLIVVNVSNPAFPASNLSFTEAGIKPSFMELKDNTLFVSAGRYFLIYDVSTPSTPVEVGRYIASSPNLHVRVSGNYAYIAGFQKGLRILNISDVTNPTLVSETGVGFNVGAIEKTGTTVYVGGENSPLIYLNVSSPASPEKIGEMSLPDGIGGQASPYDLYAWKDFLFVADGDSGIHVVGITNRTVPELGSTMATLDASNGLFVDGLNLFVADYGFVRLLEIFETTDFDGDGVVDGDDFFPNNPDESADNDNDGVGDNADIDDDNDGVLDDSDAFPFDPSESVDSDGDNVGDNTDAFPNDSNESLDFDRDGIGDNADLDDDNDGIPDGTDALPNDPFNLEQVTFDGNLNGFPKLDNNQLTWRGYTDKNVPTIYFQDLSTGEIIDLGAVAKVDLNLDSSEEGFPGIPYISNGQVAWRVWDEVEPVGKYKVYFWNGSNVEIIAEYTDGGAMPHAFADKKFSFPPSFHSVDVVLHNGQISWAQWDGDGDGDGVDDGTDYEIMFWDGATIHQITDNNENDYEPQINNGQIAWTGDEATGTSFDVFFWDGASTVSPNIINVSDNLDSPDEDAHLMNGWIVWSGYTTNAFKRDTYVWDGSNTTILSLPGNDYEPQINNDNSFVTWHNKDPDTNTFIVYIWDLYGVEKLDMPQFSKAKSPFANDGRVVFTGTTAIGPDLYIADIRLDKDEDGTPNGADAFPLDPTEFEDSDLDGIGNNQDLDDDNDGVLDVDDLYPLDQNESMDSDNDTVGDNADFFPFNFDETGDADLDGIGDSVDLVFDVIFTPVSSFDTNGHSRGMVKDGSIVYLADGVQGLKVFQLDDDGEFIPLGTGFKLPSESGVDVNLRSIKMIDQYLYLAYREKGLYILDISDPANPVQIFRYDTPDRATFLEIDGTKLYLSDRTGLLIFDISITDSPVYLGRYTPPNEVERVTVSDGVAYAAVYYTGVRTLDVSDPTEPTLLATSNSGFAIWAVEKVGDYLFAGGEGSGLIVYDVSNPLQIVEKTTLALPSSAKPKPSDQPPFQMVAHGTLLFIADGFSGVQVVDISDPLAPVIVETYDTADPGYTWDILIEDYTLLIGDHEGGIHHINLGASLDNDSDGTKNYFDSFVNDPNQQ